MPPESTRRHESQLVWASTSSCKTLASRETRTGPPLGNPLQQASERLDAVNLRIFAGSSNIFFLADLVPAHGHYTHIRAHLWH